MPFTVRFVLVLIAGVAAAIVISPFFAAAGFHIPFPRIFDRTVMVTLLLAILWSAGEFEIGPRLARGFAGLAENLPRAARGFIIAMIALGILGILAVALGGRALLNVRELLFHFPKYVIAATVIAIIEEGFFRAFLLDGMEGDFGEAGAVAASSAVYALAHLLRSPTRFYVAGLDTTAGVRSLLGALAQLANLHSALPPLIGLFLIGLILGEGFALTGTVYYSLGIHAGLIVGLRSWRATVTDRDALPAWLFGYGRFPLVSGVAGWLIAAAILALLRPLARGAGRDGGGGEVCHRSAPSRAGAS